MLASSECKVCGKSVIYESSGVSNALLELNDLFYCSNACLDFHNWGSKSIRGYWLIIIGWLFMLASESDTLIGLIGIPTFILGVIYFYQGQTARKRWSLSPKEEIEITEFTDEYWDEAIDIDNDTQNN